MKKLVLALSFLTLACLHPREARAELVVNPCGSLPGAPYQVGSTAQASVDQFGVACGSGGGGGATSVFTPNGNYANLTATAASASVALPAGTVVKFANTGTAPVSCVLGVGSATAVANRLIIQPGSWDAFTVGSNTFAACIDQTGSASNLVVLNGGTGLPSGSGGGSAGGGGGAATIADGADVAEGATANTACASDTAACTALQRLSRIAVNISSLITAVAAPANIAAAATGGCTGGVILSAASNNSTNIKNAAGTLCELTWLNTTTTLMDIRLYDTASAPTCSSATGIVANYPAQSNATSPGATISLGPFGKAFANGIGICITGANSNTDNTNAVTGLNVNYSFK